MVQLYYLIILLDLEKSFKINIKKIMTIDDQIRDEKLQYDMTVCSCHVMYAFHSESTLYSCLYRVWIHSEMRT